MRNKSITRAFYLDKLGFDEFGNTDFDGYMMIQKDNIQIHFFEHHQLDPLENFGQVYIRVSEIDEYYKALVDQGIEIHPNGQLQIKPWGQKEFSLLDPDHNLLTFGESV